MSLPTSAISTNSRRYARAFLIDPNLRVGTNGGAPLPYVQDANGSINPVSARVMIVSSLAQALPVSSGVPYAALNSTRSGMPQMGEAVGVAMEFVGRKRQ
jgi:hypothetical protein